MSQSELYGAFMRVDPSGSVLGSVWGFALLHRSECIEAARAEVERLLDDPTMTRQRMKAALTIAFKRIGESGP